MKIILWDIETAPMVVTSWGLFKPRLSHENIIEDTTMISASWKTLGEGTVHSASIKASAPRNDLALCKKLRAALVESDVLVAHNGDKFDLKIFNSRLIHHGLDPLPPIKMVDTLKVAKRHFRFTSNRLDYLGAYLGCGRKISTEYGLWLRILLKHDADALASMVKYNEQDVRLLERVYLKLRPYMTSHPNQGLFEPQSDRKCPLCGSNSLQARGYSITRVSKRQRFQCQKCGGWSSGAPVVLRTKVA